MRLALGCDDAAFALRDLIRDYLVSTRSGWQIEDFGLHPGTNEDYPDIAIRIAEAVAADKFDRAIIFCGTGLGVAIAANKVSGIRAATVHDSYSAEKARTSNNAQIITLGARVIGPELAKIVIDTYLDANFTGGPSEDKVNKICAFDGSL